MKRVSSIRGGIGEGRLLESRRLSAMLLEVGKQFRAYTGKFLFDGFD